MPMMRPASRQGMIITPVIVVLTATAITIVLTIAARCAERRVEVSDRAARIQGREWCIGASALAEGGRVACGPWEVARAVGDARSASGPRGTYRIAADGRESWTPRGAGR